MMEQTGEKYKVKITTIEFVLRMVKVSPETYKGFNKHIEKGGMKIDDG
jgi:hypothetical protein